MEIKKKRAILLSISIISYITFCIIFYFYNKIFKYEQITYHLSHYIPLVLDANLIFIVLLIFINWKNIFPIDKVKLESKIFLGIIIIIAIILSVFIAPRSYRILYDETIYQSIGKNIAYNKMAVMANEAYQQSGDYKIINWDYNKQPSGWPYLISIVYRIFGESEISTFILNNIIFILLIITIFLIGFFLFNDENIGLFSALLFSLIPENIKWSNTVASEPSTSLFLALSVLFAIIYARQKNWQSFLLCLLTFTFTINFRPEAVLIIIPIFLILVFYSKSELKKPYFYLCGIIFIIFAFHNIVHLYIIRNDEWGAVGQAKMSVSYFLSNLKVNGPFYLINNRFPLIFTLFAFLGLIFRKWLIEKIILVIWFLTFWGIFLFFYAGSYNYGVDIRYSLLSYSPMALLGGMGINNIISAKIFKNYNFKNLCIAVLIIVYMSFIPFLPYIRTIGEEGWSSRVDVKYAREFSKQLPDNSIIFTHNPNMFLVWGKSAAQAYILASEDHHYVNHYLPERFTGGIYFHWNYWCNIDDPMQKEIREKILTKYEFETVSEYSERNFRYALYKIIIPKEDEHD